MAAISIINNGEAMSSVRSKLNNVITEINLLDPTDWIDYSATSTIVGWSSFITKTIKYRVIGKQVFVSIVLDGISNSATTTLSVPFTCNLRTYTTNWAVNNGSYVSGALQIPTSSNVITFYQSGTGAWTSSGSKQVYAQLFYEIA